MCLCVLVNLLGRTVRVAMRRVALGCLRFLLFVDDLLLFTLLMSILYVWETVV